MEIVSRSLMWKGNCVLEKIMIVILSEVMHANPFRNKCQKIMVDALTSQN